MKNVNTIREQVTTNREHWFQYRRTLEANLSTLEALYAAQYDAESPLYHSTPAQTVAAFVESVGYEAAVEIVASLVNHSAWDRRISRRCAEWANAQENSWDEEACSRLSVYTNLIHKAHLDQIAAAMMKYEPAAQEAQEAAQEIGKDASKTYKNNSKGDTTMTVNIYKSYGVLAHEKQPFYSVSAPANDVYDIVAVDIPFPTWHNCMGDIGVTIDGVDYLLCDVLTSHGDTPALMWYDGRHNHYKHLDICGVI